MALLRRHGGIMRASVLWAWAAIVVAGLPACSTLPNRDANFSATPPKPGYAAVYIGRPHGLNVSYFPLPIELNGKPLVSLAPNQYVRVDLPPGKHSVAVPNTTWARMISGIPHPAEVKAEAGKIYYLLPKRWAGETYLTVTIINGIAIPHQTAVGHSSFSVQTAAASTAPPPEFLNLTATDPQT